MRFFQARFLIYTTVLAWVCAGTVVWSESNVENRWENCRSDESCWIEFDYLSNQETDPFMFIGRIVDEKSNKWSSHHHAIERFSDVRDCLVKSEQTKPRPNLLLIDWDQIGFDQASEICVFRIGRSLGDIQLLKEWFEYHGFFVVGPNSSFSDSYEPQYKTEPTQSLLAKWSDTEYEARYKARKGKLFQWFASVYGIGGFAFNVRFSEDGSIVSIEGNWTGKH